MASADTDAATTAALNPADWQPLAIPLGGDDVWTCEEPSAAATVRDGIVEIGVERFERSHDAVQILDNPKHLLVSPTPFDIPPDRPVTFSAQMGAETVGGNPHDFRDGFAAFNVLDMSSGLVLDHAATSARTWAILERLLIPGMVPADEAFTWMVEAPLAVTAPQPRHLRTYAVTIDPVARAATWTVDETVVFHAPELPLVPQAVHLGVGLITLHPLDAHGSTSLRDQGMRGLWANLDVTR